MIRFIISPRYRPMLIVQLKKLDLSRQKKKKKKKKKKKERD